MGQKTHRHYYELKSSYHICRVKGCEHRKPKKNNSKKNIIINVPKKNSKSKDD